MIQFGDDGSFRPQDGGYHRGDCGDGNAVCDVFPNRKNRHHLDRCLYIRSCWIGLIIAVDSNDLDYHGDRGVGCGVLNSVTHHRLPIAEAL